ncbi:endonuclease [Engelhardtia mirabilis]|uniref:Extracellular ribonuclease n=1 Tax=Engelhardtia mirabilis TaxID=2528011 RepID=A0A518BEA2_9BACT|nr:Extracellular ribonuclease precursor [Planctomycetes bacterium Pla133]QDU99651.1 Extracellular ribonuclease precursor [Planctomycetes bacterium Pla86]
MKLTNLLLPLLLVSASAAAQAPPGYYDPVDSTTTQTLRASLHEVIDDHQRFPYTSSSTDTWNIIEVADEDPNNASRVLDVYKNASYAKFGGGNSFYNREHSWPKSYGFPNDGSTNYPYTDCHHLFIADSSYNSSRSNKPYRDSSASASEKPTELNNGKGGGTGVFPGNSNWTAGSGTTGEWQTWRDRRGDVARALMYLDVRYEGGIHGITGVAEPDLILTDNESLIAASNTGSNESVAYMGLLSTLLAWHAADPVDAVEMARNDAVYGFQGNRNPFIDHPEWVDCIFSGTCGGGGVGGGSAIAWINELHYDNTSSDVNEGVEVAGTAGLDLSGWSIVAYNGNGGASYGTTSLFGTLADQEGGLGTAWFAISGLQNGAPDGVALVDDAGALVQFLSYEGSFAGTNGAASGVNSTDIGVAETTSTPVGWSLQLGGTGGGYGSFTWEAAAPATPGQPNGAQSFSGGGGPPPDTTPPAAPSGLVASAGNGVVDLDWSDNGEGDLDGYLIYRSTSAGGPFSALNVAPQGSSAYSDATVSNGTTYWYRVTAADLVGNESGASSTESATPSAPPAAALWINELHYDDSGTDANEGVELAGTAGLDLSGWTVVAYNGNGGGSYKTVNATGTLTNQQGGFGTRWIAISGLQNGAPDGVALVAPDGTVTQFLSYEGTLVATSGPASGMTSTDIGVSETSGTPDGQALQLIGSGSAYEDFSWSGPSGHSRGSVNGGQVLGS